jgi:CHAT domain-containing protein
LDAAAEQVDAALLRPLQRQLGDRSLVVVPTGELQALPFGLLPSCRGRAVTVAPSGALWLRAVGAPSRSGPTVVVAGPGLPAAAGEAGAVAASYDDVRLLTGADATAQAVLQALPRAGVAHIAAHSRLRADNPLFSSLLLADGPLSVYDLEGLSRVPPLVVLASCDTARSKVTSGDELLGLAACFLALGTGTLIAPVVPVADDDTAPLMIALHERLQAGAAPAQAVADLQQAVEDPRRRAAAASLVCLGGGRTAVRVEPAPSCGGQDVPSSSRARP